MSSTTETTNPNSKDYLNQIYDAQIESTKEQLTQAYNDSASNLDSESEKLKKQQQKALVQTDVEAQRTKRNYAEVQNAYGLSSGAMAQARLAQDNQHQNDMTDIRTAYLEADADVERRRQLLAQQYASAIKEAQANNDLARAQALYELAREEEARLLAQQQAGSTGGGYHGGSGSSGDTGGDNAGTVPNVPTSAPDPVLTEDPSISAQVTQNTESAPVAKPVDTVYRPGNDTRPSITNDSGNHTAAANTQTYYRVDKSSIADLGRGPITAAELNRLITAGEVEEYIVGNTIRFRNTKKSNRRGSYGDNFRIGG